MRMRYLIPLLAAVVVVVLAWSTALAGDDQPGVRSDRGARPSYPSSVESMIERRRDLLERRRELQRDLWTGRRWRQPPWTNVHRDWMDAREDAMREAMRRRRDALDQWQGAIGRWHHPWSQWRQDWNEARRNAYALDRLARDEYFDRFRYGPWGLP